MGTPKELGESWDIVIDNPNLPAGFEVTKEMLEDPTVVFFLQNYRWAQKTILSAGKWNQKIIQTTDGARLTPCFGLSWFIPAQHRTIDIDFGCYEEFGKFDLYDNEFIYGPDFITADDTDGDRKRILQYLLPKDKREEFMRLFNQTDIFNYFLSSTKDEVDHLVWLVKKTQYDQDVRRMIKKELEKVVNLLQWTIDTSEDKKQ